MVDYSRWDKIDTGTDESSGEAVPAPAHQIISPGPRPPGAVRAMDPASIMASLPDEVLVLILANIDHASCHLTRATCGRFRDLNERASVVRVRALISLKIGRSRRCSVTAPTGADSRTTTTSTQMRLQNFCFRPVEWREAAPSARGTCGLFLRSQISPRLGRRRVAAGQAKQGPGKPVFFFHGPVPSDCRHV